MTFEELNLSAPLLRAVQEAGYETPSPIQAAAIPPVLSGRDLMGCAQTGTGKTAAFALPMLDRLTANPPRRKGAIRALILTPTRELALQIGESFDAYGKYLNLRSTVIFGGVGQAPQVEALKKGVDILVACPGRLNDLIGQGFIDLSDLEIFVLDEADRMLDMGFVHDVKKVIAKLPKVRQNLMFSATMPAEIEQLAAGILRDPAFVKVDPVSSTVDRIQQSLYHVEKGNKKFLLPWLIKNLQPPVVNALVFSRTKHGADKIAKDLTKQGIPAAAIHGNKSQTARVTALEDFKAGKTRVLVATDIAARGIDISELSHVFNYDLPEVPETYVHRIGRTARAGADGTAVSFCAPEEQEYLAGIEKLNRRKIPVVSGHPWDGVPAPVRPEPPVRGKKPKAAPEQAGKQPEQQAKPAKAAAPAKPEKKAAAVPKAQAKQPEKPEKEERTMDDPKRTSGGRSNDRRSNNNNNSRPRREQNAPARGSNAQPKFDPHFVSAPEATPLRSARKAPAAPAAPAIKTAQGAQAVQGQNAPNGDRRNAGRRSDRNTPNDRNARPAAAGGAGRAPRSERNERTGTTQKSHRRPRHGLSGTDNGTFDLLKPFCSAFRCLRGLLCGFPQELLLHFLSGVCCDLCLCFHRCLSNRLRLPPCERPFTERLFSSLGRCRCGFPAPIRLRSRCIGRNRGGRIRKAMLLQRKIVLHPKGFLFRFPHHSFPATFGLLFRLLLPELLLGAHDLRRIALTQRSRIFHPLFRLGGNNGAVKLLLRQRLAGAERRPCADFRRSLCGGFKPAHRFGERRLRIFRLLCIFSVKLTTSRLFPQHLRRLFGEKRRGLPRLNIPVLGARPYLFHSDSPGFVVIRRYSAVFRGNWLMNGTSAPPTLMRPCPDSALLM